MPDWTYHTLLKPVLFRISTPRAQRWVVAVLSFIGRAPGGVQVVDFLGHMRPDRRLQFQRGELQWPGPIGLDSLVDPSGAARVVWERFGCGFLTLGPVGESPQAGSVWRHSEGRLLTDGAETVVSVVATRSGLRRKSRMPVLVRLAPDSASASRRVALALAEWTDVFVVPVAIAADLDRVRAVLESAPGKPVLVWLGRELESIHALARAAVTCGARGIWIRGDVQGCDGVREFGRGQAPVALVDALRRELGPEVWLLAGGVYEPSDARRLLQAGANWGVVDAGLVLGGPGLLKRTNEALLSERFVQRLPGGPGIAAARYSWFWGWLLGLAMLIGGILAVVFAATRVVLPYDELFCGMDRGQFNQINPRLLAFMAHDRMSLAGVMLALGWIYTALSWQALRRGAHWAKAALVVSAISGYFSFFLFLGFGYFDPFHAFITASLLPLALLCLASPLGVRFVPATPDWREDPAWLRGQWGQLLFIVMGMGFIGAGVVICGVGCGSVFVDTDLEFLGTSVGELQRANTRLLPLVAHDRASLGGMLIASGFVVWLVAQWGFRAGERWLWWALALAGNVAFLLATGVHFAVHYHSWEHLAPALFGWAIWNLAAGLSHTWLTRREGAGD